MKPINSSKFAAKNLTMSLVKPAILAVALVAAVPSVQAGKLVMDVTTGPVTWAGGFVAPTGTLDITNNNVIFRLATGVTEANVASLLLSGEYSGTNGYWDGTGINSSSAANDVNQQSTIGYIDNSQLGYIAFNKNTGYFGFDAPGAGIVVLNGTDADQLIKTTWYGDADLDGFATVADYSQWAANFGNPSDWLNGDFDGDGFNTVGDYTLWAGAFTFTANGTVGYTAFTDSAPPKGGAVPEPGSLGLLAVGALGILGRRKRNALNS